jgi:N-acetylmuramoyl-L-alanine amidase
LRVLLTIAICLLCGAAFAATESFSATVDGTPRSPQVPLYYADDIPYLPLVELAQQLGGTARVVSPSEAEVMVNGRMATISLNGTGYQVGQDRFSLNRPFLSYEREVLAPRAETVAFFRTAFGLELSQGGETAPAPAAEINEEEQGLLESVPLPAPAPMPEPAPEPEASPEEELPLLEREGIAAPEKPVGAFRTIVIDAGHGGEDRGVTGPAGAPEKEVSLAIAQRLAKQLQQDGRFKVVLTRNDDSSPTIADRANMVKQQDKPLLVSIHTGAAVTPEAEGFEVFYQGSYSRSRVAGNKAREAAETIARSVERESGAALRGVRRAPLKLFALSEAPGCLIETGCITNPGEEARLATADYQEKIARGIALGLFALAGG